MAKKPHQQIDDDIQPSSLTAQEALIKVRALAALSENIVTINHSRTRQRGRNVSRWQIEQCIRLGTIVEGPYIDQKGNWRMTIYRHAAGEELNCVVAIDWPSKLIVVTVFKE